MKAKPWTSVIEDGQGDVDAEAFLDALAREALRQAPEEKAA